MEIRLKTKKDLDGLRRSGAVLARVLEILKVSAKERVMLKELDALAMELLKKENAKSAFLGYRPEGILKPYPAAICTSVNEVIVHGIPNEYKLKKGDVLKIDLGVIFEGYITDAATTVAIGNVSDSVKKLIDVTRESLERAIQVCTPKHTLGDIGYAIETTAQQMGCFVIRGLTGHAVGFELHEDPVVPNRGKKGEGMKLVPGLVLAIEPMISLGSPFVEKAEDESFYTKDKSISAHFEHTVAILNNGAEVLTRLS